MDPVSLGLGSKIAGAAFTGLSGHAAAKGEQERARINSFVGRTRAIQTDVSAREGLEAELGSLRAVLGSNQQRNGVGTLDMVEDLRTLRGREQRISVGNKMSEVADWRMASKNAGNRAGSSLAAGVLKAGPSLFDLYEYNRS